MKLLLAIDESESSDAALASLIELFPPEGAEVRVLHVLEWPRELPAYLTFTEGPAAADTVVRATADHVKEGHALLARVVARLQGAGFTATAHLVEGVPRQEIVGMATSWPADAIVIGSHGRHGLDRVLLGSVSNAVVRHARCSVYVVRAQPARQCA